MTINQPECETYANGNKYWYLNGILHRDDGPAVECVDGEKHWYVNGRCHRNDGPAVEFANGGTEYWINGNHIPQLNNMKIYGKENLEKLLCLI